MAKKALQCDVNAILIVEEMAYEIDKNFIKYIVIEDQYLNYNIPIIYLSLALSTELYQIMVDNAKIGKFILSIQRINAYSSSSLFNDSIEGEFTYILSSENPNYSEDLEVNTRTADNSYSSIVIALFNMELLNKSKTSFNGSFSNIDVSTLMFKAVEDIEHVVMKAPKYNVEYETEVIPALNSRDKLLKYLFSQSPFYDTNYIFFMDFNRTYLIDMTGEGVEVDDGELPSVIFDIRNVSVAEAYFEGVEEINDAYYLYINPANCNVIPNEHQDKIANQLVGVSEEGEVTFTDLDVNRNEGSEDKQSFKRNINVTLMKNMMESNTIIIELEKEYIDGSIFTPNKIYHIQNYTNYEERNGDYILIYKREVIFNHAGVFNTATRFGLRKIGNIEEIGFESAQAAARSNSIIGSYTSNPSFITSPYTGRVTRVASNSSSAVPRTTPVKTSAPAPSSKQLIKSSLNKLSLQKEEETAIDVEKEEVSTPKNLGREINVAFAGPVRKLKSNNPTDSLRRKFY